MVGVSAGARAAGLVIAAGYLLGWSGGPVLTVLGALGLITYGRAITLDRARGSLSAVGLAVIAGAVGVAALRWGTLDLDSLRGVQEVFGPTVAVGPDTAAIASGVAAAAAVIGTGAWVSVASGRWVTLVETLVAGVLLTTVFYAPPIDRVDAGDLGGGAAQLGLWVAAAAAGAGISAGIAVVFHRMKPMWAWVLTLAAGVAAIAAAAVVVAEL